MEPNEHILNRLARSAEARSATEIIEQRSIDRRTQQRRAETDERRGDGRTYQVPRRVRGKRRQSEDRRATE